MADVTIEQQARELLAAEVGCNPDDLEAAFIQRDDALRAIGRALAAMGGQREALLANPHTGTPRDYRDVESDPTGVLIHKTGEPLRAAPHQPEAQAGGEVSYAECCDTPAYCSSVRRCTAKDTPPPSAVPEGLTARDRCVLRFALHRFMGEAYARHNEASQKTTAGLYASGAAERFYRDAKDAERLLSVFAAAPAPKEGV